LCKRLVSIIKGKTFEVNWLDEGVVGKIKLIFVMGWVPGR